MICLVADSYWYGMRNGYTSKAYQNPQKNIFSMIQNDGAWTYLESAVVDHIEMLWIQYRVIFQGGSDDKETSTLLRQPSICLFIF